MSNTDSGSVVKTSLEQEIVSKARLNEEANKGPQSANDSIGNGIQKSNFEIRIPKPNFDTQGIPLFNEILEESNEDPRNRHALMVLLTNCTEDACPEEPKTLKEALRSPESSQ
jgi:hypothetical protein